VTIEVLDGLLLRVAGGPGPAIWLVHGFGESSRSLEPLFTTPLRSFAVFAPDLPGFGASPPRPGVASLDALADVVADMIRRRTPDGAVCLVGHSLGGPIAVGTARRLGDRVRGLFSIEGNLTEADAYFSGQAAQYDDADVFKREFTESIWRMAGESRAVRRYFASLAFADAETLWRLGRDAAAASRDDALGAAYRALRCPTLYYWGAASTTEATRRYLRDHAIVNQEFTGSSHWPTVDIPDEAGNVIGEFFRQHLRVHAPTAQR
jgi:pimeloyl-ACP methyl ester carboxylesterase